MPQLVGFDRVVAEAEEQVGPREEVEHDRVAGHPRADAREEPVLLGQDPLRLRRGEDRRAEPLDERADRGDVGDRIEVEPEEDDRAPRVAKQPRHRVRAADGCAGVDGSPRLFFLVRPVLRARGVARQGDVHRPHPRFDREPARLAHRAPGAAAVERDRGLREGPVERGQVDGLVRREGPGRRGVRGGDRDDRRAIEPGVGDPQRHVDGAGAERRDADRRPALERPLRVRGERRRRLVPGEHEVDPRAARRLDEVEDLTAREAVHPGNTRLAQHGRHRLGHGRHRVRPPRSPMLRARRPPG